MPEHPLWTDASTEYAVMPVSSGTSGKGATMTVDDTLAKAEVLEQLHTNSQRLPTDLTTLQ